MSGKDFLKIHVLSWQRKVYSDWEDVTSSGRVFQVFGLAAAPPLLVTELAVCCLGHVKNKIDWLIDWKAFHFSCNNADHLIPASDAAPRRGRLRSANRNCLIVPRCQLSTYGCRAFDYAGPTVWNSLPGELRNSDSFDSFKLFMKTILFSRY